MEEEAEPRRKVTEGWQSEEEKSRQWKPLKRCTCRLVHVVARLPEIGQFSFGREIGFAGCQQLFHHVRRIRRSKELNRASVDFIRDRGKTATIVYTCGHKVGLDISYSISRPSASPSLQPGYSTVCQTRPSAKL